MNHANGIEAEYEALLQFLYLAPVGLVQMTPDGGVTIMNPLAAQLLMPLSRDGGLDNLFRVLEPVAPELRNLAESFTADSGTICDSLRVQLTAGIPGRVDPRMLSVSLLRLDAARTMAVLTDITVAVKRERQLRQSEAWFNAVLNDVTDYALMALDTAGRIEIWNPGIARLTGYDAARVTGQSLALFHAPGAITPERIADRLHEADCNGWSLDEGWCVRADGSRFWASTMIAPLTGIDDEPNGQTEEARGYALIIRDISDRRDNAERLLRESECDHLTGIANRRKFFQVAELELQRWNRAPRPLALLVIDADHFKRINDTWGHAAGDAVLRNLARTLTSSLRDIDAVARIGGEEFAALLPSTDLADAMNLAQRLCDAVAAQRVDIGDSSIGYTVSIGVAVMHKGIAGLDLLLREADAGLYSAKRAGRNRIAHAAPTLENA
ncbi:sensor domain-containing diguanylate cyclase [Noviherbaspirillum pedocola]|uniref:GGDEF domain-containing protein n=1 Tax=Noviherbaspirillum pedocola TaxID=2801341 RepID=A0A934SVW7_9BURK|nr:sensor domain-containing diguanylate cyclase [Noviherbaspirillum pedocola]MBK4736370.1 GGDEF domain-containing protein [Noviherbaspirillum pedocola]